LARRFSFHHLSRGQQSNRSRVPLVRFAQRSAKNSRRKNPHRRYAANTCKNCCPPHDRCGRIPRQFRETTTKRIEARMPDGS
jgi:hypothetical protein